MRTSISPQSRAAALHPLTSTSGRVKENNIHLVDLLILPPSFFIGASRGGLCPSLAVMAGRRVPTDVSAPTHTKVTTTGFIQRSGGPLLHLQHPQEEQESGRGILKAREEDEP
jgi:hypothetical protein